jgi:hypothetical protein
VDYEKVLRLLSFTTFFIFPPEELPILDCFVRKGDACRIVSNSLQPLFIQFAKKHGIALSDHLLSSVALSIARLPDSFRRPWPTFAFPIGVAVPPSLF